MVDQLIEYDRMLLNWLQSTLNPTLDKTITYRFGTPDRAFAETVTPTGLDPAGRPPVPRIAIAHGDPERIPEYYNSNRIRKLGYSNSTRNKIRQAKYPVPVRLPYTLNIWTEYRREMNVVLQKFFDAFPGGEHIYLPLDVDAFAPVPCYGIKEVGVFYEGQAVDTGSLEPGKQERLERRTINLHTKAWIWDFSFVEKPVILDVESSFYSDRDMTTLFETVSNPNRYKLYTADGTTTHYGPVLAPVIPIVPGTFFLDATVNGDVVRVRDDGTTGALLEFGLYPGLVNGTVNYSTGAVDVIYTTPPDADTDIVAGYRSYLP